MTSPNQTGRKTDAKHHAMYAQNCARLACTRISGVPPSAAQNVCGSSSSSAGRDDAVANSSPSARAISRSCADTSSSVWLPRPTASASARSIGRDSDMLLLSPGEIGGLVSSSPPDPSACHTASSSATTDASCTLSSLAGRKIIHAATNSNTTPAVTANNVPVTSTLLLSPNAAAFPSPLATANPAHPLAMSTSRAAASANIALKGASIAPNAT
mmetsp:Transcript_14495/g.38824  ORF Transcript_14495/g.38824 Transcript_14495/m.38824 type:complete len:214 (-) Transcript_14495:16-657(-)